MEEQLTRARALLYGSLAFGATITGPWLGWWTLLPVLLSVVSYRVLRKRIPASDRPEFLVAGQVCFSQTLIAIAIALTGGPTSPILVLSFLPLVTLPARFGTRGVTAGVGFTVVVLCLACIATDPQGFADAPSLLVLTIVGLIGLTAFSDLLQRTEMRHRSQAVIDPLTGLLNRHALDSRFAELAAQAGYSSQPVALVICDVDRFKSINDEHGHARGDAVLKEIAYTLRTHTRTFELIYRFGGDEFLIVLPGRAAEEAGDLARRFREAIAEARPGGLDVTVSIGVAGASGAGVEFEPLFEAADQALYRAKAEGRNRVAGEAGTLVGA